MTEHEPVNCPKCRSTATVFHGIGRTRYTAIKDRTYRGGEAHWLGVGGEPAGKDGGPLFGGVGANLFTIICTECWKVWHASTGMPLPEDPANYLQEAADYIINCLKSGVKPVFGRALAASELASLGYPQTKDDPELLP